MTSPDTNDSDFTCRACDFTAPVRPGAGWTICPNCGSDQVTSPPPAVAVTPAENAGEVETTDEEGA